MNFILADGYGLSSGYLGMANPLYNDAHHYDNDPFTAEASIHACTISPFDTIYTRPFSSQYQHHFLCKLQRHYEHPHFIIACIRNTPLFVFGSSLWANFNGIRARGLRWVVCDGRGRLADGGTWRRRKVCRGTCFSCVPNLVIVSWTCPLASERSLASISEKKSLIPLLLLGL